MPADDIERIVDRKLIKQRVHYYVVWKGFGEENNTWCVNVQYKTSPV